jgi:hypothetical protein
MALVVYDAVIKSGIQCGISAMSASFCCLHQEKWKLALKYIKMAEEFDPTSTRIQENREYIVAECAKKNVKLTAEAKSEKKSQAERVRLTEKKKLPGQMYGYDTYEVYQADTAIDAKAFLDGRKIAEPQYYVIVESPEGIFGKDKLGLYNP